MAVRAPGCRLGLQLDYSTRRTTLVHDVTLGGGEGAGNWFVCCLLSACTAVNCGRPNSCRPAALIRKTATGFVGGPTNYFARLLAQNKTNHRNVLPAYQADNEEHACPQPRPTSHMSRNSSLRRRQTIHQQILVLRTAYAAHTVHTRQAQCAWSAEPDRLSIMSCDKPW